MSVNVFGHSLSDKNSTSRGPPGIGFKLTGDGQFDIEGKRICNLTAPQELNDAVNLDTLKRTIQIEIRDRVEISSRLRSDLDNLSLILEAFRKETNEKLAQIKEKLTKI